MKRVREERTYHLHLHSTAHDAAFASLAREGLHPFLLTHRLQVDADFRQVLVWERLGPGRRRTGERFGERTGSAGRLSVGDRSRTQSLPLFVTGLGLALLARERTSMGGWVGSRAMSIQVGANEMCCQRRPIQISEKAKETNAWRAILKFSVHSSKSEALISMKSLRAL
jgi:hypothetical protein